ncbi:MAG: DUF3137 domain-containing protein [Erysipelotrichaceae bacterium]|nr:DUF3137 domain-containing protein [Erysipelotrichaceae bacterium]
MNKIEEIKNKKRKFKISVLIFIGVVALFEIVVLILGCNELMPLGVIALVLGVIVFICIYYSTIVLPFKNDVVRNVLMKHKKGLEYSYKVSSSGYKDFFREYRLVTSATSFRFSDAIYDEVDGYYYTSMDLHATHTQSTGKSTTTITDFKGKVFIVENMEFPCDFVLKEEWWKNTPYGFKFIELESIDFNTKFNLYTASDIDTFKIFTPKRIRDVLSIEKKYDNVLTIAGIDNTLYVLSYDYSDQFEDPDDIIRDYEQQCQMIRDYIDIFVNKWRIK